MNQEFRIRSNGIELVCERLGDPAAPAVLLIMGLGGQLVMWPDEFCQHLVAAGYQVIRFDNRDIGLSSKLDTHGVPNIPQLALRRTLGLPAPAPYKLDDMATDTLGLLDALKIATAHVVGVSMGGMIAQILAARQPQRVRSLAAIMTSSGHPLLPGPSLKLRLRLIRPRSADPEIALRDSIRTFQLIGSPAYPQSAEELRPKISRQMQRNVHPPGVARQLAAILASGSRTRLLKSVRAPTLILHGREDPLVPVAAAHDLARRIPHARCEIIDGMGHDLPPALLPRIGDALLSLFADAEALAA